MTPLQAAVAGVQKVSQFNTQVTVVCRKKNSSTSCCYHTTLICWKEKVPNRRRMLSCNSFVFFSAWWGSKILFWKCCGVPISNPNLADTIPLHAGSEAYYCRWYTFYARWTTEMWSYSFLCNRCALIFWWIFYVPLQTLDWHKDFSLPNIVRTVSNKKNLNRTTLNRSPIDRDYF